MTREERRAVILKWIVAARDRYYQESKYIAPHSGLGMCSVFHDTAWHSPELSDRLADLLRDQGDAIAIGAPTWRESCYCPEWLRLLIPEFNREFLGGTVIPNSDYWWPKRDLESRFRAFDKLVEVYSR